MTAVIIVLAVLLAVPVIFTVACMLFAAWIALDFVCDRIARAFGALGK